MARKKSSKRRAPRPQFRLSSPDIRAGGTISMEQVFSGFGCTGRNLSPALAWSGAALSLVVG